MNLKLLLKIIKFKHYKCKPRERTYLDEFPIILSLRLLNTDGQICDWEIGIVGVEPIVSSLVCGPKERN